MQQQIIALQAQLQGATDTPMQSADDTATLPLLNGYSTPIPLPRMAYLDCKAPATILTAVRAINKSQRYEDNSLKQLQYQLSAVYCPLEILSHELVIYEAYAYITYSCNNSALRVINPSFTLKSGKDDANNTPPLDESPNNTF
ncbi:hypothetical protein [Parasitella parasitica]|uniref:Uncharacterized protein n=1 Tax=Parasitella parasitica TaxID=35722 RepID=A0A0B7NMJ1_9FUNG|nr:hypothetical protein [Parasitella parasitica]